MDLSKVTYSRLLAEEYSRMAKKVEHDLLAQSVAEKKARDTGQRPWEVPGYRSVSPKDTGALRRRSLDLTRALADMRRT